MEDEVHNAHDRVVDLIKRLPPQLLHALMTTLAVPEGSRPSAVLSYSERWPMVVDWAKREDELDRLERELRSLLGEPPLTRPNLLIDNANRLPAPTDPSLFVGRDDERALLMNAWQTGKPHVLVLVADGGVGKTSLVWHFVQDLRRRGFDGAAQALDWSFYSQGQHAAASDSQRFLDEATRHFNLRLPTDRVAGAEEVGGAIARKFIETGGLLVLDGVEPLQYLPGQYGGGVKDAGLRGLLRVLASAPPAVGSPRLLVVTTRWSIPTLKGQGVVTKDLSTLSDPAGAELLRRFHLEGTNARIHAGDPQEFEKASNELGGHALALELLASWLLLSQHGDLSMRRLLPPVDPSDDEDRSRHARRVMRSYEEMFARGSPSASDHDEPRACVELLHALGLFDRPAPASLIQALRKGAPIDGLRRGIQFKHFERVVRELRRLHLLAPAAKPDNGTLDAHPLVREHFGVRFRREHEASWFDAHGRLFEHLCKAAPNRPDTAEAMEPLFQAVVHGCKAGREHDALADVYFARIQRGSEFFASKKIGAIGPLLSTLAHFFEADDWTSPIEPAPPRRQGLKPAQQQYVLAQAGFGLRSLGRSLEAEALMGQAMAAAEALRDWMNAAIQAGNLSALQLMMGRPGAALESAQFAARWAAQTRTDDRDFRAMVAETKHAAVLHACGRLRESHVVSDRAERMQRAEQPGFPILYSMQGFLFCDLLLDESRNEDVGARAARTLGWVEETHRLLDIALDHLSLGRAFAGLAQNYEARRHLDLAVEGLRRAGVHDQLPRGLLARAAFRWSQGADYEEDLAEALDVAESCGWLLHECDACLLRARIHAAANPAAAREDRDRAANIISGKRQGNPADGYHRRDVDLLLVDALLAKAEGRLDDARAHLAAARARADEMGYRCLDTELDKLATSLAVPAGPAAVNA